MTGTERGRAIASMVRFIEALRVFAHRHHAAARRYLTEVDPREQAQLILDNADPDAPILHLGRPRGR